MLLGGVVALVVKPEVRNRLLDALFGPEEQFEYDSVTEPVAPPIVPDQRAGGEHVAAGAAATPDWQPPAEDSSHGYAEQEPEAPDGPLRAGAGDETPAPASEPWKAPAAVDAPEETPTVAYEPWSASGDAAAAPEEPGSPSEEAVAAPEEPWSPSGESAAAREDEPELIVYREAARLSSPEAEVGGEGTAWIEPSEDFEADLPEPSADSTLDHGELAGEDSNAAVAEGTADQAEADAEEQQQPAIGEAESPRSGWWMPRRRRPDGGTREPPRWD
jgi:hypothetical protein